MSFLGERSWLETNAFIQGIAAEFNCLETAERAAEIHRQVSENRQIHECRCVNLNPATNVMNPRAEALLASGIGSRPSLGVPGDKYEMGLEAIERIEIYAAELACEVFGASFAEIRVASGAMANLYAFMACCRPGDTIIVPPVEIGGHVTHHPSGAAGLFGLNIVYAPYDAKTYSIDVNKLAGLVNQVRPRLITVGGSLNLTHHPVRDIADIAATVGARVLFDAAHLSGLIAGRQWPDPLAEGADLMTMSTYKSLGGPPSGLLLTNNAEIAQKVEQIAFPGLTANFDAAKSASLALGLLDWIEFGRDYAATMCETSARLSERLEELEVPVFKPGQRITNSHQFAVEAHEFGGGQLMAGRLRSANLLSCGIGLPLDPVEGDMNGLRLGTPECVRWGMDMADMDLIAGFIADVLLRRRSVVYIAQDVMELKPRRHDLQVVRQ